PRAIDQLHAHRHAPRRGHARALWAPRSRAACRRHHHETAVHTLGRACASVRVPGDERCAHARSAGRGRDVVFHGACPMSDEVILNIADGVAHITLNRPRKMNAVTPDMAVQIEAYCRAVDRDESVRAVLVSGSGERAFCAGSDLGSLTEYPDAWSFRNRLEYAHALRNVRKPVVAALRGWVLGGGGELALAADLRVGGRGSRYGFPEVAHGWVGGGGASQMLPRLI